MMKKFVMLAIPILSVVIGATVANAQPSEDDINPQNRDPLTSQPGSATAATVEVGMTAAQLPLERAGLLRPDMLEGAHVTRGGGEKIGRIADVVRQHADAALYAVLDTDTHERAAVRLSELEITALAVSYAAQDKLGEGYASEDYVGIAMSGIDAAEDAHSGHDSSPAAQPGQGGLAGQANATGEAAQERADLAGRDSQPGQGGLGGAANPAGQDAQAQPGQAGQPGQGGLGGQSNPENQSGLEHIAVSAPQELAGKKLVSMDGDDLGEIEQIVRKISDDEVYAVITMTGAVDNAVVPIEAMEIAEFRYAGDEYQLDDASFDAADYQSLDGAD